jgi:DNA-binding MarR family transcriptional regulator
MKHYKASSYAARSSIGYMIKRAHGLMRDRLEAAIESQGFTFMQWAVLMYVRDGIALTLSEICRDFAHDSGALTRVVDQLEQRGLVQRRRGKADRRVVELELTPLGSRTIESLIPLVVDRLNWALEGFSVAEFRQFKALLEKLLARLQEGAADDSAGPTQDA